MLKMIEKNERHNLVNLIFVLFAAFLLNSSCSSQPCASMAGEYAVHPAVQPPKYLPESLYLGIKLDVPPPPAPDSAEQKSDEATLLEMQKKRAAIDCQRAGTEVKVTVLGLFGGHGGPVSDEKLSQLEPFFNQIRNDSNFFVQKMKTDYARPRPFNYISGLKPCISKESTFAYPSGHATIAKVFADVLEDLYPRQSAFFQARASEIGLDRVLGGVHHPSDIEAGRKLGDLIYSKLQTSLLYQSDFAKLPRD